MTKYNATIQKITPATGCGPAYTHLIVSHHARSHTGRMITVTDFALDTTAHARTFLEDELVTFGLTWDDVVQLPEVNHRRSFQTI